MDSVIEYLRGTASTGQWVPVGHFADDLFRAAVGCGSGDLGELRAWRRVRRTVLAELRSLGLVGTVWRTDRTVALATADVRAAGLVRLRPAEGEFTEPTPHRANPEDLVHHAAMYLAHRLRPAAGVPAGLPEFCGVVELDGPSTWPAGFRHPRAWIGPDGLPVLTVEVDVAGDAETGLALLNHLERYPVLADGPHPGHHPGAKMLTLRWDPSASLLAAVQERPPLAAEMFGGPEVETWTVMHQRARDVRQPSRQSIRGLVAKVLGGADQNEQIDLLFWAVGKLYEHLYAGYLDQSDFDRIVGDTAHTIGLADHQIPGVLAAGWRRCDRSLPAGVAS